ncbi:sensor histidine kinase [Paenibacillus koleovorans]|uniref:sensor histidine kinase n=1 Tax=Paenibacillus koleovorans TaxID=121608 RepID=UPI0013E3F418|nr:histidine kinase [Paenibacillus koleovorans]
MLLIIVGLFFVPFLVLCVYWYTEVTSLVEEKAVDQGRQIATLTNDHLDSYFNQLEITTSSILTSPLVKSFLQLSPTDDFDEYAFMQRISNEIFVYILSNRTDIYNVSIVSNKGLVVSSYSDESALAAYRNYAERKIANANFTIIGIRWINNVPVLTITRNLINSTNFKSEGLLIIDLTYQTIAEQIKNMALGGSGELWVFDSDGNIVYYPNEEMLGRNMAQAFPDIPLQPHSDSWISPSPEGKKLFLSNTLDSARWQVVNQVPLTELTGDMTALNTFSMLIILVLAALALTVMGVLLLPLTRSVQLLQRLMKKAEIGDLEARAPEEHQTLEIASLYRSYNSMVSEIRRLIEVVHLSEMREKDMEIKQIESRLLLMQSQINPHFLYNTLEVVNSYAIEAGVKPVSKMIVSIAKMFRYNMNDLMGVVSLAEEMEHLNTYLMIQKERFHHLTIQIDLDEEALAQAVSVRLALQPVVENSFKHGYDKAGIKAEYIGLFGRVVGGCYIVTVSDRGHGMDEETMVKMNTWFTGEAAVAADPDKEPAAQSGSHIGLWNVHTRLRLSFGEDYGLRVAKSDSGGTDMELLFPLR